MQFSNVLVLLVI